MSDLSKLLSSLLLFLEIDLPGVVDPMLILFFKSLICELKSELLFGVGDRGVDLIGKAVNLEGTFDTIGDAFTFLFVTAKDVFVSFNSC